MKLFGVDLLIFCKLDPFIIVQHLFTIRKMVQLSQSASKFTLKRSDLINPPIIAIKHFGLYIFVS
jgi:hypothetical protein